MAQTGGWPLGRRQRVAGNRDCMRRESGNVAHMVQGQNKLKFACKHQVQLQKDSKGL